jgi:YTH domain-containing family protein
VNGSGYFIGMAQMMSRVDYESTSTVWAMDKWRGVFQVRWVYLKDIGNARLRHIILSNNEDKPVTNSRDTQEILAEPGRKMLQVFGDYRERSSLLDDFDAYDQHETRAAAAKTGPAASQGTPTRSASARSAPTEEW